MGTESASTARVGVASTGQAFFDKPTVEAATFDKPTTSNAETVLSAPTAAPQFGGVTSWDFSAKSVEAEADTYQLPGWTDRHSSVEVVPVLGASAAITKTTNDSLPGVSLTGGDKLRKSSFSGPSGPVTVFVVAECQTYVRYSGWLNIRDAAAAATANKYEMYMNTGPDAITLVNRPTGYALYNSTVFTINQRRMFTAVHGNTASVQGLYFDETRITSTNGGPGNITMDAGGDQLQIGAGYNDGIFNGIIHEIVIYDAELDATQLQQVWDYLQAEWTIGGSFPE